MLDPAISLIIKLGFTLLLVGAGGHKLTNRIQFRAILQAYQILPVALVPLAGLMLGMFELVLGFVWAAGWQATPAAWATALQGLDGQVQPEHLLVSRRWPQHVHLAPC